MPKPGTYKRVVTPSDRAKRETLIEELWFQCVDERRIIAIAKRELDIGPTATRVVLARVRERCQREHEENRVAWKHQAVERISREIRDAKKESAWGAVASFERLLADIQGTREPLRVDVNVAVNQAVVHVIGSMSAEQMQLLLEEYNEMERRAKALPVHAEVTHAAAE